VVAALGFYRGVSPRSDIAQPGGERGHSGAMPTRGSGTPARDPRPFTLDGAAIFARLSRYVSCPVGRRVSMAPADPADPDRHLITITGPFSLDLCLSECLSGHAWHMPLVIGKEGEPDPHVLGGGLRP
jgi:hypothetical protein